MSPADDDHARTRVDLHLPWQTFAKIALFAIVVWAAGLLAPLALSIVLAALLATSLQPLVGWFERRGLAHGWAVLLVALAMIASVLAIVVLVIPPIIGQASGLAQRLPHLRETTAAMPQGSLRSLLLYGIDTVTGLDATPILKHAMTWGQVAVAGAVELGVVLILAVYLLLDGDGVLRWLVAFVPSRHRAKVHETAQEMAPVVFSYVAGQVITSLLCAIYSFVVLTLLHVPAALLLAVLAGVCDVLPVVGFIMSAAPAVALAAMVSPTAAALVFAFYVLYHAIENYGIIPYVYGSRLRLSTLTVLVTLLAAFLIAGVGGAIAALPLVASYAIIERRWLRPVLHPDTVRTHERIEREEATGDKA